MKICSQCGAKLNDEAVFCTVCGNKVEEVKMASEPVQVDQIELPLQTKKSNKKKGVMLAAGMVAVVLLVALVLTIISKQGFVYKKTLSDGTVAKYKMVSLNKKVLLSITDTGSNKTVETFYSDSGEPEKEITDYTSGARDEVYYEDGLANLKKRYNTEDSMVTLYFRITSKMNQEENTLYDCVLQSIPALVYPMLDLSDYDAEEHWEEFIYDEEENIVQYFPDSEVINSYYQYEYYSPGKLKESYCYNGENYTQVMRYYESGVLSAEEQYDSEGELASSAEYDETGEITKTTEVTTSTEQFGILKNGARIEDVCYADGATEKLVYNNGSKLFYWYTYDTDGNEVKYWERSGLGDASATEYEYYPGLDVVKSVTYYDKDGNESGKGGEGTLEDADDNMQKYSWYNESGVLETQILFDENGKKQSSYNYTSDGVISSERTYDSSGNLSTSKNYNGDGTLHDESSYYSNGDTKKSKTYNSNGVLVSETSYTTNGRKTTSYREDGTIKSYDEEANGYPVKKMSYYDNGNCKLEETFVNDEASGYAGYQKRIEYNEDGTVKQTEEYKIVSISDLEAFSGVGKYMEVYTSDSCGTYTQFGHKLGDKGLAVYYYDGNGNLFKIYTHEPQSTSTYKTALSNGNNYHRCYVSYSAMG